jgi:hypothetical protein
VPIVYYLWCLAKIEITICHFKGLLAQPHECIHKVLNFQFTHNHPYHPLAQIITFHVAKKPYFVIQLTLIVSQDYRLIQTHDGKTNHGLPIDINHNLGQQGKDKELEHKWNKIQINNTHICKLLIWKHRFNMIKDTCLFPFVVAQNLLVPSCIDSRTTARLINDTLKTQRQANKKQYTKQ